MMKTIESFDTKLSADSVEWCPAKGSEDIFVCGTYQLTPDEPLKSKDSGQTNRKIGQIYLFKVITKNGSCKLKLLQELKVAAILDMKWNNVVCLDKTLLAIANAEGFLQIYELTKTTEATTLTFISESLVGDDQSTKVALSLEWSNGRFNSVDNTVIKLTASDSLGNISLFQLADSGSRIDKIAYWSAHGFEAWVTTFDYWNNIVIYTGGDDCKFLKFDTRENVKCQMFEDKKTHNAGVTSLQSSWKKEHILLSGSYDEVLRTWDSRNLRRHLGEVNLAGGVWRLKWDPFEAKYVLAAAMYNGFALVDCDDDAAAPKVVAEYKEHQSIAYGCGWSHRRVNISNKEVALVATCSFYDHTLKLSTIEFSDPS